MWLARSHHTEASEPSHSWRPPFGEAAAFVILVPVNDPSELDVHSARLGENLLFDLSSAPYLG